MIKYEQRGTKNSSFAATREECGRQDIMNIAGSFGTDTKPVDVSVEDFDSALQLAFESVGFTDYKGRTLCRSCYAKAALKTVENNELSKKELSAEISHLGKQLRAAYDPSATPKVGMLEITVLMVELLETQQKIYELLEDALSEREESDE